MPIPANAQTIYKFLLGAGLSPNAAAGILGNIEQESGGNPHAGSNPPGSGLIQQLGDPGGSLAQEMPKIIAYIKANGSIGDINRHSQTPTSAALWFSSRYERPGIPNNQNRVQSAIEVAHAAQTGNWGSGVNVNAPSGVTPGAGPTSRLVSSPIDNIPGFSWIGNLSFFDPLKLPSNIGDVALAIEGFVDDFQKIVQWASWLFQPANWVRVASGFGGVILLLLGTIALVSAVK